MSSTEIIAAVVSTVLVAAGGIVIFISKQREARRDQELRSMLQPKGRLDLDSARTVRKMMQAVVSAEGTAPKAAIPGYTVAGKTGTVKKSVAGGYAEKRYLAVFAGMVPATDPRLVMVVMVNEPRAGKYYGGQVAAPVFSGVMSGALRLLNIPPDVIPEADTRLAAAGGGQ